MWGYGWGYWGWGWWFWIFWAFIVFLILVAVAGITGTRTRTDGRDLGPERMPPEEQILRERYARGEINREEFDQKMRDLRRAA